MTIKKLIKLKTRLTFILIEKLSRKKKLIKNRQFLKLYIIHMNYD